MQAEDKQLLWRASSLLLGFALPTILLGKAVVFVLLGLGLITGGLATKDESLRATVRLMLESRITWLVVVFMLWALVGVFVGIDVAYSFDKWLQLLIAAVVAAVLFMVLREMPGRHVENLLWALVAGTLVMAGLGMLDALWGYERLSAALHGVDKATTPYRLNFVSSALAVLLPFVWARLFMKARDGEAFAVRFGLAFAALSVVALLVCGGRAGWVGGIFSLVLFLWLGGRYHGVAIHRWQWLVGILLVPASMALYALAYGQQFMWERASVLGEAGVGRGLLSGRLEVWSIALQEVLNGGMGQLVWGIGVMNYRNLPQAVDLHPHNWAIQLLLETGVVGLGLFVVMMGMVLVRFFGFAKGNIYGVAAVAAVGGFLLSGLANTSIFNLWWLAYLIFVCLLGWRAGWSGDDMKKRRRGRVVKVLGNG
ncbi:MAG: O-antigen ligase domain-containing protein [Proteobacteria bacterium]|nr:O-antigen ligase domain-containing protein [Pseudomonadota bacterium]